MSLLPLIIFIFIIAGISSLFLLVSKLLSAKGNKKRSGRGNIEKEKSGFSISFRRYEVKFHLAAILFLLIKVQIILIFPWILSYSDSNQKQFMVVQLIFFLLVLMVGYIFILLARAFDWDK